MKANTDNNKAQATIEALRGLGVTEIKITNGDFFTTIEIDEDIDIDEIAKNL